MEPLKILYEDAHLVICCKPVGVLSEDDPKAACMPALLREHYRALAHHASECIQCGACEKRCPFSVPVREKMKQAAELFGC